MQLNTIIDARGTTALQTSRLALTAAIEASFGPSFASSGSAAVVIATLIVLTFFTASAFNSLLLVIYSNLHHFFLYCFPCSNLLVCSQNYIQIFIIIFG